MSKSPILLEVFVRKLEFYTFSLMRTRWKNIRYLIPRIPHILNDPSMFLHSQFKQLFLVSVVDICVPLSMCLVLLFILFDRIEMWLKPVFRILFHAMVAEISSFPRAVLHCLKHNASWTCFRWYCWSTEIRIKRKNTFENDL